MKRTWTALLAVAVLAVAAGVVWWWLGRSAWHPPASIKPALPDIALPQDGVPPQVKNALEKPLLWSSRAPVEAAEAESSKAPESELSQLRLMAVLESAGQRVALVKVDNLLHQVRVGNYLGQNYGRVNKIDENEVVLREIVQDAAGEWIERNTVLQLQEKAQ